MWRWDSSTRASKLRLKSCWTTHCWDRRPVLNTSKWNTSEVGLPACTHMNTYIDNTTMKEKIVGVVFIFFIVKVNHMQVNYRELGCTVHWNIIKITWVTKSNIQTVIVEIFCQCSAADMLWSTHIILQMLENRPQQIIHIIVILIFQWKEQLWCVIYHSH